MTDDRAMRAREMLAEEYEKDRRPSSAARIRAGGMDDIGDFSNALRAIERALAEPLSPAKDGEVAAMCERLRTYRPIRLAGGYRAAPAWIEEAAAMLERLAQPPEIDPDLAELVQNCRIAAVGSRLTAEAREWINRLCDQVERLARGGEEKNESGIYYALARIITLHDASDLKWGDKPGFADSIDNDGNHYPSSALATAIESGRAALASQGEPS